MSINSSEPRFRGTRGHVSAFNWKGEPHRCQDEAATVVGDGHWICKCLGGPYYTAAGLETKRRLGLGRTTLRDNVCPHCGEAFDCASSMGGADSDAVPKPGDLSLCAYCLRVNKFADDLTLIRATPADELLIRKRLGEREWCRLLLLRQER